MHAARVIVGTDGSPSSLMALWWAAREAQRREVPLTVVLAYNWRTLATRLLGDHEFEEYIRDLAVAIVDAAMAEVRTIAPRVHVRGEASPGEPAPVLLEASDGADMVVVGSRGGDRFACHGTGSVSAHVAAETSCPMTVVVRGRSDANTGPVIVGVDGSTSADVATGVAFEEAASRRCALRAVLAYSGWMPPRPANALRAGCAGAPIRAGLEAALVDHLAGWRHKYPDVQVGYAVGRGSPGALLTWWSRQAQLVTVGRRSGAAPLSDSVGRQLIRHADCPVLIAGTDTQSGSA
ncbi:universal stress protein [Planosporangium flavigriseum]|nr:universal stress protein [Planosporangium flavigriseum]